MAEYHQIFGAAITKKMKTEQVTGAIEKLLEGSDIESIRAMVNHMACVSYRSRIGYHFGLEGLLKVSSNQDK